MKLVLFVCTGNTCRSPMAAGFFNRLAEERGLPLRASSAGTDAHGSAANDRAANAARVYGVDLLSHRPRMITGELVREADTILTMEESQIQKVLDCFPQAGDKLFAMLAFIGRSGDIADPIGGSDETYHRCARQLWEAVGQVMERLATAAEGTP